MDWRTRLAETRLYLVCDDRPGGRPLADVLPAALAGGVDIFQLRMKDADDDAILAAAEVARAICADAGVPFVLNDRPDLAAEAGADGVHVGQDDMPVARARELLGPGGFVGLSTHSVAQADASVDAAPDYIAVGPVHATPTKEGRPAIGLEPVRHAAATASVPWFAIGGIDMRTVAEIVGAGARRVAVVRAIADADDPEQAARSLRLAVGGAAEEAHGRA